MRVIEVTSLSITVQWESVPCLHKNGEITGYIVHWMNAETDMSGSMEMTGSKNNATSTFNVAINVSDIASGCSAPLESTEADEPESVSSNISVTDLSATLTGLRPSTNYSITVAAINSASVGEKSHPIFVETDGQP